MITIRFEFLRVFSFVILVMSFLLSCSKADKRTETEIIEDKAKVLIGEYLNNNLKDPSSYEAMSYQPIDSVFTSLEDDALYSNSAYLFESANRGFRHKMEMQEMWISEHSEFGRKQFKKLGDEAQEYIAEMEKYKSILDSVKRNFVSEWMGWSIAHTYRAKNGFGALDIYKRRFIFDKDVINIISSDEIK